MILPSCRRRQEDINKDFTKQETVWNENGEVGKMTGEQMGKNIHTTKVNPRGKNSWMTMDKFPRTTCTRIIQSIRRVKILSSTRKAEDISLFTRGMNSQTITSAREENHFHRTIGE